MLVVPPPTIDSALSAAAFLNISAADLDTSSSSTSSLANFEFEYEEGGCEDEDHLDDEETEENVTMNHEGELLSGMRRRKMGNADVDAAQPTSSENANDVQLDLPEASNILEEVWLSIFTPGINSRVVMVMDVCFYALFLVLLGMFVITGANVHVGFLIVITGCLFVSVKWFIAESAKLQAEANLGDAQRAVEPVPEPASKDE
ncbi:ER protein Pkr1-domain-containing protein [Chytriomyces sp. MP71]|nr:ER protein Pkr1-domain-containing protein [Chytriomyces sp. MP71]